MDGAPYVCVFDLETAERIDQMAGIFREDKIKKLTITCGSVLCIPSELCLDPSDSERALEASRMRTFWVDQTGASGLQAMVEFMCAAELVIGFNSNGFDFPVLEKYVVSTAAFQRCREKSLDLFTRIRDVTSTYFKLDTLLILNEIEQKVGDGLLAIKMWHDGDRAGLKRYCEQDVRSLARLALLPTLSLLEGRKVPNHVFGVASALASVRRSAHLAVGEPAEFEINVPDGIRSACEEAP